MSEGTETALELVIGTDHDFIIEVLDEDGVPVDISLFALSWIVKRTKNHADSDALLHKTTVALGGIVVAGAYSATRASNVQRATVTVKDTDTDDINPGVCCHELKRTDVNLESRLSYGTLTFVRGGHKS